MSKIKIAILIIGGFIVLSLVGLGLIGYYANKNLPEMLEQQEQAKKQQEIKQIQELVQKAIETGEKEPLITISENGFSQEEIKIETNSFISFYNSTDQEIEINSRIIKPGVTASMKFKESAELKLKNKILKIYVE